MQVDTYRKTKEMLTALEKRQDYLEAKPSIWPPGTDYLRYGYRKSPSAVHGNSIKGWI